MYDLLIKTTDVLQLESSQAKVLPGHSIAIQAGKIAAIAPDISSGLAKDVIDAKGMLAFPGFVNTHSHTAMGLFRGIVEDVLIEQWFNSYIWPMEMNLTEEDVYWGTMLGISEMISAGVTTFADHYFAMDEVARAVEESGIRADLAWAVFSGENEREQLQQTLGFVKRWNGAANGRITTRLGPHSPYTCTPEFLAHVAQVAKEHQLGVHIHLSETADQVAQSRAAHGKTPIALLRDIGFFSVPTLAAHVAAPQDDDIAILAEYQVAVSSCPKTEMKLGTGVAPIVNMLRAGVTVGLGSDGAASNNSYDMLEVARLAALLEKHTHQDPLILPMHEVLNLATHSSAAALGLAGTVGKLEVGQRADIVLLNYAAPHLQPIHNPAATLLYSAQAADIDTVLVDGRVLMRGRKLLTIDKARVLAEVAERTERLIQRREGEQVAVYPNP